MVTFLSTGAGVVILFLVLYFFPASYSKAGKMTIFAAACLFTLIFLAASSFLPMWNIVVMLLLLILAVSYLISKRVEMVKVHEGWEEDVSWDHKEEDTRSTPGDIPTSMSKTYEMEDDVLPAASMFQPSPTLAEEKEHIQQEVAFTDEMAEILDHRAHTSDDEAEIDMLPLKETEDVEDLMAFTSKEEENRQEVFDLMDEEHEQNTTDASEQPTTNEDYIEELDFIGQLNNEETGILPESSESEEEDASISSISIPELPNSEIEALFIEDYNVKEIQENDGGMNGEQIDFIGEKNENWPELDEELLALFEEEDQQGEQITLSSDQSHEEAISLSSPLNEDVLEITEEEEPFRSDEEIQHPVEKDTEEKSLSDASIQDILNEETNGERAEEIPVSVIEREDEDEEAGNASEVLRQQLWDMVVEQLQLYKRILAPEEYEALLKDHLSANLSGHEHYVLATMFIRHYTEHHQYGQARELLVQLQQTYAEYPVLLEELNYLELNIND